MTGTEWFWEIAQAIGLFFIHPLTWVAVVFVIATGWIRVRRERFSFQSAAYDVLHEWRQLWKGSLLGTVLVSVVLIGLGASFTTAWLALYGVIALLSLVLFGQRLASSAYSIGMATFLVLGLAALEIELPWLGTVDMPSDVALTSVAGLVGLLLLIEGFWVKRQQHRVTTPMITKGKRGKFIGTHHFAQIGLVPAFLLLPSGLVQIPIDGWPILTVGEESFTLICVPFLLGAKQRFQTLLPAAGILLLGKQIVGVAGLVLVLAIGSFWIPALAIAAVSFALIGRELATARVRVADQQKTPYFTERDRGLLILDTLPDSPAEKMGLEIGEVILKANGVPVKNDQEFYEALQHNRTYCKLEVQDVNGELRFAQRALYKGEHHELGIFTVALGRVRERAS